MAIDDAKAKIEEMLRKKREGNTANSNTVNNLSQNTTKPVVTSPTISPVVNPVNSTSAINTNGNGTKPKSEQSSNVSKLGQINEILRQKQLAGNAGSSSTGVETINNINNTAIQPPINNVLEQSVAPAVTKTRHGLCPSCLADLDLMMGLYVCKNCTRRFVRRATEGDLIDCRDLPYGYCQCCEVRFPLVKTQTTEGLVCSVSREKYLLSAKGYLRSSELPFGLCACCQVPNPLVATQDRAIRCISSNEEYIRNVDGSVVRKPVEVNVNLQTNNDVEAALNQGTAAFYYGGFIGGQQQEPPPAQIPKRQRRRWFL